MKICYCLKKEWKHLWHGKMPAVLIVWLLPLVFTLAFGFIYYQNTVESIATVVYDEEQSAVSRTVVEAYSDSDKFKIVAQADSYEAMQAELAEHRALVGLYIPKDLAKSIKQGQPVNLLLIINSANNMFGNAALTAATEINKTLSTGIAANLLEAKNLLPSAALNTVYPVRLGVRIVNNPATGYSSFMLAGLTMNGLQIAIMLVLCPLIAREFREHNYGNDISSAIIIFTKTLLVATIAVIAFGLDLIFLHYMFAIPIKGSLLAIFAIIAAFSLAVAGIMTVFAAISSDEVMSIEIPLLYIMPGLLYSGLSWPDFYMNDLAISIAKLFPLWHAGDAVRDLLLAGYTSDLVKNIWQLIVMGSCSMIFSAGIFAMRRRCGAAKIIAFFKSFIGVKKGGRT